MTLHDSTNPRHYLHPEQDAMLAIAAIALIAGMVLHGCKLPDVGPVDPVTPTTTTTTSTTQPDNAGLVLPRFLYGGAVSPGEWPQQNADEVADACEGKVNLAGVMELIAPAFDKSEDGYNDMTIDTIVDKAVSFIRVQQFHGLWVCLHVLNGNDEVWRHYSQADMRHAVERIYAECGIKFLIIVPVAEMQEAGDNEFAAWCLNYWMTHGGIAGWNGAGRPDTIPAGVKVCDYHTQDTSLSGDFGPSLAGIVTLLDTDNGRAIGGLRAPYWNNAKVKAWFKAVRAHGASGVLYAFQFSGLDTAIDAIAEAYEE